ncbi:anhydro-N-acetylmuramic acid kinase [Alteromonas sp. KUL42]|uniref:anhydro-N-acetylmuramic acid kinase n=1 Tax=Alteromonas sp. KUL42 TaxID=2480797 RepID=UPI001036B284|nr:anhydro-N-acetylmuramic acid kinase [Alteromonas sp. KUL42]TAP38098.1 anhydro-N-acetylmuramic acid kinase [Alteromonas sp. KUL42]GEA05299.1 anhydro-N-acetylmuramic acid kinase [Alteromonas sp. KUL42]
MAKYIGLMSGTSMDGVDAVLCEITSDHCATLAAHSIPYPQELLAALNALCSEGPDELNTLAIADRLVAETFANAALGLLEKTNLVASDIIAIGSHGQTVRHHPSGEIKSWLFSNESLRGFTCQIGDPNTIAALTNIDVVADFRRKDIALGGQGAPLVPAYHNAVFAHESKYRALVNIGGIANVSLLPPKKQFEPVRGFDTGPGNTLMDKWILQHLGLRFDDNGQWAASGTTNEALLSRLLCDAYFSLPAPKSTGREYFNLNWLQNVLSHLSNSSSPASYNSVEHNIQPVDVQATLLTLTVETIVNDIKANLRNQNDAGEQSEVVICGGGAFNNALMRMLEQRLLQYQLSDSNAIGIHPQHVEGAAFAWLAHAYLHNIPGNVPEVTGASRPAVLGALFKK